MKFFVFLVFIVISAASSYAELKKDTLVLLDSLATRETHSVFFKSLQGKLLKSHIIAFVILSKM